MLGNRMLYMNILLLICIIYCKIGEISCQSFARNNGLYAKNAVTAIGCYRCSSINGSDLACEDEFVAKMTYYKPNCMAAKKSNEKGVTRMRTGLYPATHCIKFKATDDITGETHTIRDCAADSGGTTYDTEIGGISHCGLMRNLKYNDRDMKGCIMTCKQNGCNSATILESFPRVVLLAFVTLICYSL